MKQEDRQLLLKDLSARLPYGVKCKIKGERSKILVGIEPEGLLFRGRTPDKSSWCYHCYDIEEWSILPYLRPMSSMSKEEDKEWQYYKNAIAESCDESLEERISELQDYLNAHHFDCRGLIPKGLAIEVTEENNPY